MNWQIESITLLASPVFSWKLVMVLPERQCWPPEFTKMVRNHPRAASRLSRCTILDS
jgi:hypothetical protein